MKSGLWGLAVLGSVFALSACETGPCAELECGAGSVCVPSATDPSVGECRCGDEAGPLCGLEDTCLAEASVCVPAAVCGAGTQWAPGQAAFREATAEWGLAGVEGVRLTVTDIDGDGWADLEVRRGSISPDAPNTWLLRNTGGDGFEDVTEASGVLASRALAPRSTPGVFAWGDVDNDGDLDAYVGRSTLSIDEFGVETSELLLNDGAGRFTLGPIGSALRRVEAVDNPGGAAFVDVDHDGVLDLWVAQADLARPLGEPEQLFVGDGAGGFTDGSAELGIVSAAWTLGATPGSGEYDVDALDAAEAHTRAWSAAACDLDGDGYAELLASSYGRSPNHLWRSMAGAGYVNHSVASGYAYDGDLTWQDNQFAICFCRANPSAEGCETVTGSPIIACGPNWDHARDRSPWRLGGNSGATICGDVDNDGDLDLLTTEIRHAWAGQGADGSELLINDGSATFTRPGDEALGLAVTHDGPLWDEGHITAAMFDFDNDGWPDIYIGATDYPGNHGLLYQQESPLAFREVPVQDGIDHNRSHGIAVADFDRDGDLDVIVGHSRARCGEPNDCYATRQVRFFENVAGDGGNFVQLHLEGGEGTNRAAIGARVRVTAGGVTQTQEVGGGHGHFGAQQDLVLHFGLGAACEAEVEVRWPDASLTTETFSLPAGHRFRVAQGGTPVAE